MQYEHNSATTYLGPLRKVFNVLASAAVRLALESVAIVKLSSSAIKVFRYGFSTPNEHIYMNLFLSYDVKFSLCMCTHPSSRSSRG